MTLSSRLLAGLLTLGSCIAASPANAQTASVQWTEIAPAYTRTTNSIFGTELHWDGERLLVGSANRVDIYRFDGTSAPVWEAQLAPAVAIDGFPSQSALDHGRALVIANDPVGQSIVEFTLSGTTWSESVHVVNPMQHWGDGTFVAPVIDGARWAVSQPYISGNLGSSDSVRSPLGSPITWTLANRTELYGPGVFTGHVLALRGPDFLVSVLEGVVGGSSGAGFVSLYRDTGTDLALVTTINNPSPSYREQFGDATALDDDRLYIGSHLDDTMATDAGAFYVFDRAGGVHQSVFGTSTSGRLGGSIALSGDWLAVGQPGVNGQGVLGRLFLYQRDAAGTWQQRASIPDVTGAVNTSFSGSLQLRGNVIVTAAVTATASGVSQGGRVWYGTITEGDGGACTTNAGCTNGHCVSGICCDTACGGACDTCGTGTCAVMACTIDAGVDAAVSRPDAGFDAAMSTPDAGFDAGLDAAARVADSGVDAGPMPDSAGRAGDGSVNADADAGSVPRQPLSCTCRTGVPTPSRQGLTLPFLLALGLVARRVRQR